MWYGFPLRPEQASTIAEGIDHLYYFLTAIDLFFTAIIFLTIFYFAIRYRRRSKDETPTQIEGSLPLEVAWTVIPLVLVVVTFVWSASLFIRNSRPPTAATEVFVIGKQWMWQLQHPEGVREINELHVPVGRPIKLTMTFGRRHPRFLHSRVSGQKGRHARPVHEPLVSGDEDRVSITCSARNIAGSTTRS